MDYNMFLDWLTTEKGLGSRSAHDVISRCRRILKLTGKNTIEDVTGEQLISSAAFQCCSMFIKSQLKRTMILSQEFISVQGERNGE